MSDMYKALRSYKNFKTLLHWNQTFCYRSKISLLPDSLPVTSRLIWNTVKLVTLGTNSIMSSLYTGALYMQVQ